MKRIILFLAAIAVLLLGAGALKGSQNELLQRSDIQKTMSQILQEQGKSGISQETIEKAFQNYFDQFDGEKIYLLEKETLPSVYLKGKTIGTTETTSLSSRYAEFEEIQQQIQKAILRARKIRQTLYSKREDLVEEARSAPLETIAYETYPYDDEELTKRIKKEIASFIAKGRKQLGEQRTNENLKELLSRFEKKKQSIENGYMGIDELGHPLSEPEQTNAFVMHVLKALVKSLDAHTSFYNSNEAYDMRVRLQKETQGIGIVVAPSEDGGLVVQKLIPGGPAAKSGLLQVNDRILEVNDHKVAGEPIESILEVLRGRKEGSDVHLTINREVSEDTFRVVRVDLTTEEIPLSEGRVDVETYPFDGEGVIGRIALHSFYQGAGDVSSEEDVKAAIAELKAQGNLKGLILDLRDNSGGFLNQAVKVAGLFITDGVVVISKYFTGQKHYYRDTDSAVLYDGPLIILVSKVTASAAEIVAQALQDYGVALIVGDERTFGKGTIQSQTITGSGKSTFFKVTVGKYYTVSGKTPQLSGVRADILVPGKYASVMVGEEYLDHPLTHDQIQPSYDDPLVDVDPSVKAWYMRYYIPSLQKQRILWKRYLPQLQKDSAERIKQNTNYQKMLELAKKKGEPTEKVSEALEDFQLQEALNIVKEMVDMQAKSVVQ